MDSLICPECGARLIFKPSKYGGFYGCERWRETKCPGAHGAHPDGSPLGTPASQATRRARVQAHAAFDQLWKSKLMSRKGAYRWMQAAMGLSKDDAHIGKFTVEQCFQLRALVEDALDAGAEREVGRDETECVL